MSISSLIRELERAEVAQRRPKKKTAKKKASTRKKTAKKKAPARKKTAKKKAPARKKTAKKKAPARKKAPKKKAPARKKGKLTGKAKAAFLKRMATGRRKAARG